MQAHARAGGDGARGVCARLLVASAVVARALVASRDERAARRGAAWTKEGRTASSHSGRTRPSTSRHSTARARPTRRTRHRRAPRPSSRVESEAAREGAREAASRRGLDRAARERPNNSRMVHANFLESLYYGGDVAAAATATSALGQSPAPSYAYGASLGGERVPAAAAAERGRHALLRRNPRRLERRGGSHHPRDPRHRRGSDPAVYQADRPRHGQGELAHRASRF